MTDDRDARIRERAYALWEEEGRPEGRQDAHWAQALQEMGTEDAGGLAASDESRDAAAPLGGQRSAASAAPRSRQQG